MKKLIAILLILSMSATLLALSVFNVSAADVEIGGVKYNLSYDKSHYTVDGFNYDTTDLAIQPQIDGIPVTAIDSTAFLYNSSITSITIPASITSIGYSAFDGCKGLTTITIPASVTSIGYDAFDGCVNLKTINCEAKSKPSGWNEEWLGDCTATVRWGVSLKDPAKKDLGDINANQEIDSMDYVLLKRAYFATYKLNDTAKNNADINQNGKVDSMDYVLLKRAYFGTYAISGSMSANEHDWEAANCTNPKNCRICGITQGEPEADTHLISGTTMGCIHCDFKLNQADYKYLASSEFRRVKNEYSSATPLFAYVTLFMNKNGEICVLTDVWYKIRSNYNVVTLHNLSTGDRIESPADAYKATANRYVGATKIRLLELASEVLQHEINEQTKGTYVTASELY